ncbi:MAG: hypothetical protein ACTSQB_07890 [Candidatus Heimdallarchaeota archaeon]
MKELVDAFYRDRSIVNHQIGSYNDFLERRIQTIVDSTIIGQEEEMEKGFIYPEIEDYKIRFGKISVGLPEVKEADGTIRPLTPMEARLRDLTYEAPIELEFIPVINEVEYEPETVKIGQLPIMIKSKRCNISKKSVEDKKGHSLELLRKVVDMVVMLKLLRYFHNVKVIGRLLSLKKEKTVCSWYHFQQLMARYRS